MKGGARPGSGRKKKIAGLHRITEYFTPKEVKALVKYLKDRMLTDPKVAVVLLEQLFGKAPQRVELTGQDGKPFVLTIAKEIAEQNDVDAGPG